VLAGNAKEGAAMSLAEPVQTGKRNEYPFVSGHSRAQWVAVLLLVVIIVTIISVVSDSMQIQLLSRAQAGLSISEAEAIANDSRQATIGYIYFTVFVFTAIAFCVWIHRAHRNLPALGNRDLKYSPGWAVGAFFVPILSLFRPYQITKEIWKASDPYIGTGGKDWQDAPVSPLIIWWWITFLISSYAGYISLRMSLSAKTIDDFLSLSFVTLTTDIVDILAAILAIALVRAIDRRQEMKNQQIVYTSNAQNELT